MRRYHPSEIRSDETAPSVEGVRVGDFFVCSWGYDQTNIDFYKVVGLTPKRIKVQRWSTVRDDDLRLIPGKGPETTRRWVGFELSEPKPAPMKLKTVQTYSDSAFFVVNSYANAYLWDGRPQSDTTTSGGAGH